jgi:acyl-coenzyme A thioesterase PaaI-like protein
VPPPRSGGALRALPVQIASILPGRLRGTRWRVAPAPGSDDPVYGLAQMGGAGKDMHRWLGDGGMPIIELVGASFDDYGVDGEDLGWVVGAFAPAELACNPHGVTQAGIHSLLLDACMNFAINAALPGKARTRGTLEMKTECMRPALKGTTYALRGEVVRMAKQVAYGEATVRDGEGLLVSRATGTFLLHRPEPAAENEENTSPG